MVSGVFGLTGAGKSAFLALCARRAQQGKKLRVGLRFAGGVSLQDLRSSEYDYIYSNFPILGCYKLDFAQLGKMDFSKCLILIDEISLVCDAREFKSFPENIKYFFAMHRHLLCDVIYCSQGYRDTDLRIRNLTAQFLYIQGGSNRSTVSPIVHTMDVRKGEIVDRYDLAAPLGRLRFDRRKVYHMYDSYSCPEMPRFDLPEMWEFDAPV